MILSIVFCYLQLIGITYVVTVLMGAPILLDIIRTLGFSIYIVIIGFTPIVIYSKGNLNDIHRFLFLNDGCLVSRNDFYRKNLAWGTIIGAWLGAIPIPLDWDRWWQRWPITCLVSATMGACCSLIFSYVRLWIRKGKRYNKDIE